MKKIKSKILNVNNYNWGRLGLELIVVFLGVSSGFLLNNWRMQKQETQLEHRYILGFLQDVNSNITELESVIKLDSIWLIRANHTLTSLQKGKLTIDSANVSIRLILEIVMLDGNTSTYEDIINSGNLNIISNFNLKAQIVNYHLAIRDIGFFDDFFFKYYNAFVLPFIFSEYDILSREFNKPEIIKTIRFSNIFIGYYGMVQQRKTEYEELLIKSYLLRGELKNIDKFDVK